MTAAAEEVDAIGGAYCGAGGARVKAVDTRRRARGARCGLARRPAAQASAKLRAVDGRRGAVAPRRVGKNSAKKPRQNPPRSGLGPVTPSSASEAKPARQ